MSALPEFNKSAAHWRMAKLRWRAEIIGGATDMARVPSMTESTNSQQTKFQPDPNLDPSAGFEPTRPGPKWIAIAIAVAVAGFSIANWPAVSKAAHVDQIEHALGMQ